MEWTKPLTLALTTLVAALAVGGAVELVSTTLGTGDPVAAGAAIGFLGVLVGGTVAVGAKNVRWISNPDAYW